MREIFEISYYNVISIFDSTLFRFQESYIIHCYEKKTELIYLNPG